MDGHGTTPAVSLDADAGASSSGSVLPGEVRRVRDALVHLHDLPYLQRHPLAEVVAPRPPRSAADAGKRLQEVLLAAVHALRPVSRAAAAGRAGRRHRLLTLRYVEGQTAAEVQRRLAISPSEYFREQQRAVEAVAALLREQWSAAPVPPPRAAPAGHAAAGRPGCPRADRPGRCPYRSPASSAGNERLRSWSGTSPARAC
jgi:hypothetical protein